MLHALLSSLPEPPASTTTRLGKVSTVDGLANSLPAPPLAFQRKPQLAEMVGVPGSAFGRKRESSQSDTASLAATALGTPASSRRNTDEVDLPPLHRARLQQHASVDSLISTASDSDTVSSAQAAAAPEQQLLAAEMPPVSPFFARVSFADIDDARETVRRASLSRRRSSSRRISHADSYDRHAASWCAPAVSTSTDTASSMSGGGRLSLAEISRALADVFAPSPAVDDLPTDDLPISQQYQPTLPRALLADTAPPRWFRVDVFGLLTSQTARVTVAELGSSPHSLVDVLEPAVQRALRRYPLVLALATRQQKQSAAKPTRMRAPKKRRSSPSSAASVLLSTPTLSFTVSSGADSGADRQVRAVDVEAMAAAYLPHIHALLPGSDVFDPMPPAQTALGVQQPQLVPTQGSYTATPPSSEDTPGLDGGSLCSGAGSTATLADSLRSAEAPAEAQAQAQAKPAPRSLLRRPQRRSDTGLVAAGGSSARTPQLRASASIANLRGAYTDRAGAQQQQQQPMMSRRRSEVQALITQANAVMSSALRRSSALDPPAAVQTLPRQLRPPRASFPVYATPGLSLL
ncbi:hypothetical protein GGF42_008259, partial [Coemansia sp. RSA 2424]